MKVLKYCFVLSTLVSTQAYAAGGSFFIDDAGIAEKGEFELQVWTRQGTSDYSELTIAPAFQAVTNLEITTEVVFDKVSENGGNARSSALNLEAKYLSPFSVDSLDYGLVVAAGYSSGRVSELYSYIPVSYELNESLIFHLNLGHVYDREASDGAWIWAVGPELSVSDNVQIVASIFGEDEGRSGFEVGLRNTLVHENLEIETIYARDAFGNSDDLFTLGFILFF